MTVQPAGWRALSFSEAFTVASDGGRRVAKGDYLEDGVLPVVDQGEAFIGGYSNEPDQAFDGELPVIVFGDHTRRIKIVSFRFAVGAQGVKLLHPAPGLDPRFAYWMLQSVRLEDRGYGRHFALLRKEHFPVPSLDEQRRIVDILEDHLSRLDAAQSYLISSIAKAHAMHRGVLQSAMRGQLLPSERATHSRVDQLSTRRTLCPANMKRGRPEPLARTQGLAEWPATWTQVSLEEATHPVRTISYGILKPGPNLDHGIPYVRVLNMRGDALSLDDLNRTSAEIAGKYERATLVSGDVLVSIRGTYGRVVQVPEALAGGNITQDTARLAFVGPIDPSFACVYLRSPRAQAYFNQVARGVAVKGVNIGDLRTMPFPIPPLSEQLQIVARVDELSSDLVVARLTAESGLRHADRLRRSLLQAAFSGRLTGRASDLDIAEGLSVTPV